MTNKKSCIRYTKGMSTKQGQYHVETHLLLSYKAVHSYRYITKHHKLYLQRIHSLECVYCLSK